MNLRRNPELLERLAAEYVLGTMRGRARSRFARIVRDDAAAAQAVRHWENRLIPMSAAVREVAPPRRLWRTIVARLGRPHAVRSAEKKAASGGLWESLAFWRNLGLVASGCAAGLLVAFALRAPGPDAAGRAAESPARGMQQSYVATLTDKSGKVVLLAYAERNSDELWIKKSGMQDIDAAAQVFELWGLPSRKGEPPRSLGLIPTSDKGTIKLAAAADRTLRDFPALAISLEPAGGSRTGQPTGPVLYSGPCFKFW